MSISNPKYVSELDELAQRCTDCAEAYRRAMEQVESAQLAGFLKRRADQRDKLAGQFRTRIDQLGETPEEGGTLRGSMEKVLAEAKGLVGDNEKAVLSEVVRMEGVLKDRLAFFLDAGVPPEAQAAIKGLSAEVENDFRQLCDLVGERVA